MLQTSKVTTPAFIEALTLADDQLSKSIWLAAPGGFYPLISFESSEGETSFLFTMNINVIGIEENHNGPTLFKPEMLMKTFPG